MTTPLPPSKRRRGGSQRPHDAGATRKLIIDAAVGLLAERGFTAFGVNSVAQAAGVDKQLIYYHFGGLDGLIRHLGGRLELWLGAPLKAKDGEAYGDAVRRLLTEYGTALRQNQLVLRLLAWELAEPSEPLQSLEAARSAAMAQWVQEVRANTAPPPEGVDAPAVNALLLAALHYLALREQSLGSFAGIDIRSPEGAARIRAALELITQRVYSHDA